MLFARDKSQMCNNLLQFAHVYAWGREHGRRTISMRFSYKYPFFKIQHTKNAGFAWYLFAKYASAVKLLPTAKFKYWDCDRTRLEKKMLRHKHIVVSGWHARWYDLFLKYRSEIVDLFSFEPEISNAVDTYLRNAEEGLGFENVCRLGIHVRRGDYKEWRNGRYFYDDDTYIAYIRKFINEIYDGQKPLIIYICGNDPKLDLDYFRTVLPEAKILAPNGNPAEDLCLLSKCNYIIGAPSTFSLVASMYNDIPLCWMTVKETSHMGFRKFDELFRDLDACGDNVYGTRH